MSSPYPVYSSRRTTKSDPRLGQLNLFSQEVNERLAHELPPEIRATARFTRATMPAHWLDAILQNGTSYRQRQKSVALDFQHLPPAMVTEFTWAVERQVHLGMNVNAELTTKLAHHIGLVLALPQHRSLASLLELPRDQWVHVIRKAALRRGEPLAARQLNYLGSALGRYLDLLVHVYHQGAWWELNVWNPFLDTRIPLRAHEPRRQNLVYFSHLTTPWLREAAKWWLARQLERDVYTWTTVFTRQYNLVWYQRYLDTAGCDGPHIVDDQRQLGHWIQDFRRWLGQQRCGTGARRGQVLGPVQRRAAITAPECLYRFMFEERHTAATDLQEPRWLHLGPQHAALFRFGDKPTPPQAPPPELVLSDAVIGDIARHSELLALPKAEGGFGMEQLVRVLGLLIKTGRRISEILMLDFDPLVAIPFPDPNGHTARLRYQQTKIITDDNTILVDQEVVDLIRQQQHYARSFMADHGRDGTEPKYLFLAANHNRNGDRNLPESTVHLHLSIFAKQVDLRDELGKRVKISRTHTFRHTKATSLLNAGVPLHVAMRYMGHKTPAMFLHYARTQSTVAEREFPRYKKITASGQEYERDPAEMFEALSLDRRTDRVLPNGYCTLPPRQACNKGNACLSCTKFVTDATFADALLRQHDETRELVQRRQAAHRERFGENMNEDNVWLQGRNEEIAALTAILHTIDSVHREDGTIVPLRGAGTPQQRPDSPPGTQEGTS
ncbi:tyrosine-type recombinase/integrase [Streptomyces sp. NPDC050516]|uniref:tyrosine-type recombinase/integrase n=1 Tax=Streptomyces sp. NPDC050516 TaxID=3365621 RepID=UPI0037AD12EA